MQCLLPTFNKWTYEVWVLKAFESLKNTIIYFFTSKEHNACSLIDGIPENTVFIPCKSVFVGNIRYLNILECRIFCVGLWWRPYGVMHDEWLVPHTSVPERNKNACQKCTRHVSVETWMLTDPKCRNFIGCIVWYFIKLLRGPWPTLDWHKKPGLFLITTFFNWFI